MYIILLLLNHPIPIMLLMLLIYNVRTARNEIGQSGISFSPFDFERYKQTDGGYMIEFSWVYLYVGWMFRADRTRKCGNSIFSKYF